MTKFLKHLPARLLFVALAFAFVNVVAEEIDEATRACCNQTGSFTGLNVTGNGIIGGNFRVGGNFSVGGASTFGNVLVLGNEVINGTLTVGGVVIDPAILANAFVQGGNLGFAPDAILGTNDAVDLNFETNGVARVNIDGTTGNVRLLDGIQLQLENPAGTFAVALQAPALAGDYALTLPVDEGTLGQVLTTDGTGLLSWTTPVVVGDAFVNGGNAFGATAVLGTNDGFDLSFETNNIVRMTIDDATGNIGINQVPGAQRLEVAGNEVVSGSVTAGSLAAVTTSTAGTSITSGGTIAAVTSINAGTSIVAGTTINAGTTITGAAVIADVAFMRAATTMSFNAGTTELFTPGTAVAGGPQRIIFAHIAGNGTVNYSTEALGVSHIALDNLYGLTFAPFAGNPVVLVTPFVNNVLTLGIADFTQPYSTTTASVRLTGEADFFVMIAGPA